MPGVLVVGELETQAGGLRVAPSTRQMLTAAMKLHPGAAPSVTFLGDSLDAAEPALAGLPVSRAYLLEHPALGSGDRGVFDGAVDALAALFRNAQPDTVLLAKTDLGSVVGPRLAFRTGGSVAQDCVDVSMDPDSGRPVVTRPVFGGSAMAEYRFEGAAPHVIVARPGVFDPAPDGGNPEVERLDLQGAVSDQRTRLKDTVSEIRSGVRLEDAEVVVSGGRGLGGPGPFEQLRELANLLGGAVGASRAACDAGWVDHSHQVGLTGKNISPRLYITVGISGASQHMAGCSTARNIVAINKDPAANIFKEARYGVVGDWQKVLPAFIATVRDLAGS